MIIFPVKTFCHDCLSCQYLFKPNANIPSGTEFKDLPETWVCPVCGVPKADFVVVKD